MKFYQQTVKKPVTFEGIGLHTGEPATMTLQPAKPNHGIRFQRTDVEGQPVIFADVDHVIGTSRGTSLGMNGVEIHSVEHILATMVGLEIDNILIQLDGPEVPIMDGSAGPFVDGIQKTGIQEQNAQRNFYEIPESIFYHDKELDVEIAALPLDDYRATVMVDYNSKVLGSQHAALNHLEDFAEKIARSRTFCFLHEIETLHKQGLIKGGDLSNAVVVADKKIKQGELDQLASILGKEKIKVGNEGILNEEPLKLEMNPLATSSWM